jgi:hypothetical protein
MGRRRQRRRGRSSAAADTCGSTTVALLGCGLLQQCRGHCARAGGLQLYCCGGDLMWFLQALCSSRAASASVTGVATMVGSRRAAKGNTPAVGLRE